MVSTEQATQRTDVLAELRRDLDRRLAEGQRFIGIGDVLRILNAAEQTEATT